MKRIERVVKYGMLVLFAILIFRIQSVQAAETAPEPIRHVVRDIYGPSVEIADGHFVVGDFNGDGIPDLAVELSGDATRENLLTQGVRYLRTDPYEPGNGKEETQVSGMNCLGLGIILGYQRPASKIPQGDRFYTYD